MDLFDRVLQEDLKKNAPLADRMRPRTLDDFIGQEKIVGRGSPLRLAIEKDLIVSMILWGPPGTGKTSLARLIAGITRSHFEALNAVLARTADIKRVVQECRERRKYHGYKTIIFVDEIHRWSKNIQDALLPYIEEGTFTLIGATVENPFYTVNPALRSRSRVFKLEPLKEKDILKILHKAINDKKYGLGNCNLKVGKGVLEYFSVVAGGDARIALNTLEFASLTTSPNEAGERVLTLEAAKEATGQKAVLYDREGDQHYNVASAFIKSMRGSDPDATLYWLARMIYAGEDPRFIARRLMIHAAEDVGLADPMALLQASAALGAVEKIGMPESRIILAQAALYIAMAPKSNSVLKGINEALKNLENRPGCAVPAHLCSFNGTEAEGRGGVRYIYPQDCPEGYVEQEYLPNEIKGAQFYTPVLRGKEKDFYLKHYERISKDKGNTDQ